MVLQQESTELSINFKYNAEIERTPSQSSALSCATGSHRINQVAPVVVSYNVFDGVNKVQKDLKWWTNFDKLGSWAWVLPLCFEMAHWYVCLPCLSTPTITTVPRYSLFLSDLTTLTNDDCLLATVFDIFLLLLCSSPVVQDINLSCLRQISSTPLKAVLYPGLHSSQVSKVCCSSIRNVAQLIVTILNWALTQW